MSILRIFRREAPTDPAMLARQADEATAIHSVTIPKYRVKGNFVEYVVECSRISTTWQVYRRYQQFKSLDQQLRALCPMGSPHHCEYGVVPVLCGSHWTEVTNQSPELVERRRRYLEIYLQQLLCPKNLFYATKTALYNFLHDGEVPVLHKSRSNRPLPGFGMLPPAEDAAPQPADRASSNAPEDPPMGQVAGLKSAASHGVESAALPDLSATSLERTANQPGGPVADDDEDDAPGLLKEKCSRCGLICAVDYEQAEWVAEGRCPKCKEFTVFSLLHADGTPYGDGTGSAAGSQSTSPAKVGLGIVGGAIDARVRSESGCTEPEPEDDLDEDDRVGSANIACLNCHRIFDLTLVPRRCVLCHLHFCKSCTIKVLPGDIGIAGEVAAAHTTAAAAASPEGGAPKPEAGKEEVPVFVRVCERCDANYHRHHDEITPSSSGRFTRSATRSRGGPQPSSEGISETGGASPAAATSNPTSPQHSSTQFTTAEAAATTKAPAASATGPASPATQPLSAPTPLTRPKDVALSDFQLLTTLGRGTFGKVLKVRHLPTGHVFAMKVLNKSVIHKRRMVEYIREEANIMTSLPPHPFVCTCHFTFQTDYHVFFVLDYLPGGELYTHIYPAKVVSEADARHYIAEIVLAVEHIHKHDVAHRDLKPENIVLDADGHLKVTDFGLARANFTRVRRRSFVGSAEYLAPETIQGDVQTKALDWWSVGVMLYEMLSGVAPFHASTNNEVYQAVLNKKLDFASHRGCFSPAAQGLIAKLLDKDVRLRLSDPERIKAHPFFAGMNWLELAHRNITPPFVPNLKDNDTKYFNRDFTSEWATIRNPHGVGRQTAEMLTRRFSNFRVVPEVRKNAPQSSAPQPMMPSQQGGPDAAMVPVGSVNSFTDPTAGPPSLIDPRVFVGSWRLVTVEMVSQDGKTCYPWGSEVLGMLKYTANGLYAIQLCPMRRQPFRNKGADRITRDELSDAYLSYVASFGAYAIAPGTSYVSHTVRGALCPNTVGTSERWYFEVISDSRLRLLTPLLPAEEGTMARTVVTWERVSSE